MTGLHCLECDTTGGHLAGCSIGAYNEGLRAASTAAGLVSSEQETGLHADLEELGRHIARDWNGRLDVDRLARTRDLVEQWLDTERLLDTMTIDDGPAHQDAWDAVRSARERLARAYTDDTDSREQDR